MLAKERYDGRVAAVEIPRDKCNCGVEVVPLHFSQQSFIVDESVGSTKPRVIDREIRIMARAVPGLPACRVPQEHHVRRYAREYRLLAIWIRSYRNIETR